MKLIKNFDSICNCLLLQFLSLNNINQLAKDTVDLCQLIDPVLRQLVTHFDDILQIIPSKQFSPDFTIWDQMRCSELRTMIVIIFLSLYYFGIHIS